MQVRLKILEHEVQLGWEALESLVDRLPDDDESLAGLLHELAQSNIAAVRSSVALKPVITEETVALLASDPNPEVIEVLVRAQCSKLSESALVQIIQRNWSAINRQIAGNVEDYYEQSDITAVAKLLAGSADPSVRATLASNSRAPRPIVRQLLQDPDPEVQRLAQRTLRP
jgi:hypothetical protein